MKKELLKEIKDFTNLENPSSQNSNDFKEIDIFSKKYGFDEKFVDNMLKQDCKWNIKKEAFDELTKLTDPTIIKSIKNTDRTYFIEMVKKLLKQPNINVNHSIINALNNLCLGLNSNFIEAKDLFPLLLNFFKEKKESIINSLFSCLYNFSLLINDIIINDKLYDYCTKKPALCNIAKINLCTFIEKLMDSKENIQFNCYIPLIIKIAKYMDDPNPNVREKSYKFLAFIKYKKKEIMSSISKTINLDEKKENKIKEYENFYINFSCNKSNKKNVDLSNNKKSENKINSKIIKKNIDNKIIIHKSQNEIQNKTPNKKTDISKNNNIINKNDTNSKMSDEKFLLLVKDSLIDNKEEIIIYVQKKIQYLDNSLFNSFDWSERKNGFILLNNFLNNEENIEEINNSYDYYFKYILICNRFFNEKNCLVLIESISCINTLIDKINNFSEKYYKLLISLIINKLNEKKLVEEISNIIQKLANKLSPDEVIMTFISNINNKSNVILKEGIEIIKRIIDNSNNNEKSRISEITKSKYDEICCSVSKSYNSKLSIKKKLLYKSELSKSPLIETKNNMSKYNYNIVDVLPPEQNELPNYIKNLNGKDIVVKNLSLSEIKKILIHSIEKNCIDINIIKDILFAFNNLISSIIKIIDEKNGNLDKIEIILIRYLLDDYLVIANNNSIIKKISDFDIIYNCYEKLLLLISKKKLQSINSRIINIINEIILLLLGNFQETLTIKVLIKIISNNKSNNKIPITSLAIKCLYKFKKILPKINSRIDNNSIFVSLYEFFLDFSKGNGNIEPKNENEKNALLMIKSLISEYINIYKKSIWDIYRNSLDDNMKKIDIYFKRTIEILLREFNSKNLLESLSKSKNSKNFLSQDSTNNKVIEEIMSYVNKLKQKNSNMTITEQDNCYMEIILLLRQNKIDISILSNKIKGDIFAKIFERYYGINSSKETQNLSVFSKTQSNLSKNINKKEKITKTKNDTTSDGKFTNEIKNTFNKKDKKIQNKKEISERTKRILDYQNKYKYLTESNKNRNQKTLEKANDENKQNNNNINDINNTNDNKLLEKTIKLIDDILLKNKENKNNIINNNIYSKLDEINKMRKQLNEMKEK